MERRDFITVRCRNVAAWRPGLARAAPTGQYEKLLILIELKGGNDGLNTVVPYADAEYYNQRPRLAVARDVSCSSIAAAGCILRCSRSCRYGRTVSWRLCKASVIRLRICRIFARSKSGTRHLEVTSI